MRAHRFWRDQFHAYRMWILERTPGSSTGLPLAGARNPQDPSGDAPTHSAVLTSTLPRPGGPGALPSGVELHFLDRHARRDWVCQKGDESDWPQYRVALEHDHELIVARREDQTIGWAWLGTERVYLPPLGREIRLDAGTGYLYDAYVRPAERGHGIGRALVAARCRRADARGLDRLVSHVLVGNTASLRALEVQRFEIVGRTVFVRALSLRLWTRGPITARGTSRGRFPSASHTTPATPALEEKT